MTHTKSNQQKPKWFKGAWYYNGDTVANPFTGEKARLTGPELSMYDFIKGAEYTVNVAYQREGDFVEDPAITKLVDEMRKGIDWFREANPKAYMTLLD